MAQDELIDIIDENEKVINTVTKKEAHEKGLLHKTVVADVFDSQGRWLLIKQTQDRQDGGLYVSPMGGHVLSGETDEQAFKREIAEELGLTGDLNFKLAGKKIYNRFVLGHQENHMFVLYQVFSDQEPKLNYESESYKYFTLEEIKEGIKSRSKIFGEAMFFVVENFYPELLN